jgi:D-methionine transport system ATP-binding protein
MGSPMLEQDAPDQNVNRQPTFTLDQVSVLPNLVANRRVKHLAQLPTQRLLNQVSWQIKPGCTCILGPSGAGKTTLLRCLNGLVQPVEGRVLFDGKALAPDQLPRLRQQVVLVMQEPKLLGMTVQEALAYPLKLRGMDEGAIQVRLKEWGDRLEIPAYWGSYTEAMLSAGQRQWISLARGLLCQPKVLLLDEPTSALDLQHQQLLVKVLQGFCQGGGTLVIASHQVEWVQRLCDRGLILSSGQIYQTLNPPIAWDEVKDYLQKANQAQVQEWGDEDF